jgi:hypothetical protein
MAAASSLTCLDGLWLAHRAAAHDRWRRKQSTRIAKILKILVRYERYTWASA